MNWCYGISFDEFGTARLELYRQSRFTAIVALVASASWLFYIPKYYRLWEKILRWEEKRDIPVYSTVITDEQLFIIGKDLWEEEDEQ